MAAGPRAVPGGSGTPSTATMEPSLQGGAWPGCGHPMGRTPRINAPLAPPPHPGDPVGRDHELLDEMLASPRSWRGGGDRSQLVFFGNLALARASTQLPGTPRSSSSPSTHRVSLGERAAAGCKYLVQCPAWPLPVPCLSLAHPLPALPMPSPAGVLTNPCTKLNPASTIPMWDPGAVGALFLGFPWSLGHVLGVAAPG